MSGKEKRVIAAAHSKPRQAANAVFYTGTVLFLLLTIIFALNSLPMFGVFGLHVYPEYADDMEPAIPRGSLLITMRTNVGKILPGDIVTFQTIQGEPLSRITRVVVNRQENPNSPTLHLFTTKRAGADGNDRNLLNQTNILGVKIAVLPGGAAFFDWMRTLSPPLFLAFAAGCLFACFWDTFRPHTRLKAYKIKKANKIGIF